MSEIVERVEAQAVDLPGHQKMAEVGPGMVAARGARAIVLHRGRVLPVDLIAQIQPFPLEDILLIGYGLEEQKSKPVRKRRKAVGKQSSEVVHAEGLLSDNQLAGLADYPPEAWQYIRERLASKCPTLREKFNPNSRYLGYATGRADGAYVYVQRKRLRIDLGIPADRADELFELPTNAHAFRTSGRVSARARERLRAAAPSAIEPDGSAWPLLVGAERDPELLDVLLRYEATGAPPLLLLADLRPRGSTLVRSEPDAVEAFNRSGLDALVVGTHLYAAE